MSEPTPGIAPEAVAIRNEMATVNAGSPRARELDAALQGFYRGRYPEPAAEVAPTDAPPRDAASGRYERSPNVVADTVTPQAPDPADAARSAFPRFTAPDGQTLDADAVVDLRKMELTNDVPVSELEQMTGAYAAAWARRGDTSEARLDQRDAALLEAWGDNYERALTHAEAMAQKLPPRVREHAKQAGMFRDAMIWIKLAALWDKTHGR